MFDIVDLSLSSIRHDTLFELPAPKPTHDYTNGLQHMEIVVASVDDLLLDYPDLSWDTSGYEKLYNRDISLHFVDKTEVKFHEQSLREVLLFGNR